MSLKLAGPPPEPCEGAAGYVKGHNRLSCDACDTRATWEVAAKPWLPSKRLRDRASLASRFDWEAAQARIEAAQAKAVAAYAKPLPKLKPLKPVLDHGSLILEYPVEGYLAAVGARPLPVRQYTCWRLGSKGYTVGMDEPEEWPCGHGAGVKHTECGRFPEAWKDGKGQPLTEVTVYFVQLSPGYWSQGSRWDCGCITDRHEVHLGAGFYGKANHVKPCARHTRPLGGLNADGTRRVEGEPGSIDA